MGRTMDDTARRELIAAHLDAMSRRTVAETSQLALVMLGRCWPGGTADRSDPSALDWVRRWGPKRLIAMAPDCSCPQGHCPLCN
jgi:hypothetical protein